jgi:hypothetical protein
VLVFLREQSRYVRRALRIKSSINKTFDCYGTDQRWSQQTEAPIRDPFDSERCMQFMLLQMTYGPFVVLPRDRKKNVSKSNGVSIFIVYRLHAVPSLSLHTVLMHLAGNNLQLTDSRSNTAN